MTDQVEIWATIPRWEETHWVSSAGRVLRARNRRREWVGKIIGGSTNPAGYQRVKLRDGPRVASFYVHRLVLMAHDRMPDTEDPDACHVDGDPGNNDRWNLRWDLPCANYADQKTHGTNAEGERHGNSKLTDAQRDAIYRSMSHRNDLAERYGVDESTIRYVRRKWRCSEEK